MDLLVVVELTAPVLHLLRKRAWQKRFGFPVPAGLSFRQHCEHDQCAEPEHLYLVEIAEKAQARQRNWRHAGSQGPAGWNGGAENPRAKLNEEIAARIRTVHAGGASVLELALRFGVDVRTIRRVVRGEAWT